jgi:hypothetical protein
METTFVIINQREVLQMKNIFNKQNLNSTALVLGILVLYSIFIDADINAITILSFTILFLIFNSIRGFERSSESKNINK